MPDANVGSIVGYLALDRSDWDAELAAAGRKADELSRHDPNIHISTNAPTAIAQLAAVAAATKRLQDAQGAERIATGRLSELQATGKAKASQLAAAEERLAKARRGTAAATISLAAAHDRNDQAMSRAAAEANKVATETKRVGTESENAKKPVISLWGAIAALAPAAVPIAAVAGGALAGLLPVAATLALGIKGIAADMKSGALAGTEYGQALATISAEGSKLQQIAAGGLLSGIDRGLAASHGLFATVNSDVGQMSSQLGDIVAGAAPALLKILTDLDPLFVTFGNDLSKGATYLEHWATSSDGVSKFVAYVQQELPTVEHLIGGLIVLLSHLAQGAAPFGGVLLSDITLFVRALDAIPVDVLKVAIPLAVSLYAAFKAYGAITAIVRGVNTAISAMKAPFAESAEMAQASSLQTQAAAAEEAAGVARSKADEAASAAAAQREIAASAAATNSILAESAAATSASADEFALAMQAEADSAQAASVRIRAAAVAAATAAEEEGVAASAGFGAAAGPIGAVVVGVGLLATTMLSGSHSTHTATDAMNSYTDSVKRSTNALGAANVKQTIANLGSAGAYDQLSQLKTLNGGLTLSYNDLTQAVNGSATKYNTVVVALKAGQQTLTAQLAKNGEFTSSQRLQYNLYGKLIDTLGHYRDGLHGEITAQKEANAASRQARTDTQSQATATHALTTALLALASAQLASAQSEDQFRESIRSMTQALDKNDGSLSKHTAHGLANRDAFLNAASAALSFHDAQVKAGKSTTDANKTLADNIQMLAKNAIAHGADKDQVHALLAQMDLLPHEIRTAIKLDTASANRGLDTIAAKIHGIVNGNYNVTIGVIEANGIRHGGNTGHRASGGPVTAGQPYIVGENAPELFIPNQSGRIVNRQQALAELANPSKTPDQRPVEVTVYAPQSLDPMATAYAVGRQTVAALGLA